MKNNIGDYVSSSSGYSASLGCNDIEFSEDLACYKFEFYNDQSYKFVSVWYSPHQGGCDLPFSRSMQEIVDQLNYKIPIIRKDKIYCEEYYDFHNKNLEHNLKLFNDRSLIREMISMDSEYTGLEDNMRIIIGLNTQKKKIYFDLTYFVLNDDGKLEQRKINKIRVM